VADAKRALILAAVIACAATGTVIAQEDDSLPGSFDLNQSMQMELEQQVKLLPPESNDPQEQCVYYHQRGLANYRLGRYEQAIDDLKKAISLRQPGQIAQNALCDRWRLHSDLSNVLLASGDLFAEIEHLKAIAPEWRKTNARVYFYTQLRLLAPYLSLGMLKEADETLNHLTNILPDVKRRRDWNALQHNVMQGYESASARLQETRGNRVEAERLWRSALAHAKEWTEEISRRRGADSQYAKASRENLTVVVRALSANLAAQGKHGEAEYLAHEALRQTLAYSSFNTTATSVSLATLAGIKLQQGDLDSAERYARLAVQAIEKANVQFYSIRLATLRRQLGQIQVIRERWQDALNTYELRNQGLRSNAEQFAMRGSADLNWALALLRTGQGQRALRMLQGALDYSVSRLIDPILVAQLRGYLGIALADRGSNTQALSEFRESLKVLLKRAREAGSDNDASFIDAYRLRIIIEGYLKLLAALHQSGQSVPGLDLVGEAFTLADVARNSSVQRAVSSSVARATLPDPQLAELARRDQDTSNQKQALGKILARLASAPEENRLQEVIKEMQRDIEKLGQEQAALRKELLEKFPGYAALIDPLPATPADLRKRLTVDEAAISIYSSERQAYVWTITGDKVSFRTVALTRQEIQREVEKILHSVDLTGETARPFETAAAQGLYASLLAPDAGQLTGIKLINIIPHGALGQLPFALLLTDAGNASPDRAQPSYRDLPWLIKRAAIAQQSSASGFLALRQAVPPKVERRPFVGFGDPVFLADAAGGKQRGQRVRSTSIVAVPDQTLNVLEHAVGTEESLDRAALQQRPTLAEAFSLLPRLPDTAEELKEIAAAVGGDIQNEVYLGARATETNVKTADLSRYRVLAFATHGLVPGELSGLDQPALALANPALTREANNDGFLTLEEVLGLKLNADWVILSACNTASADGQASEAVSGLGRAFFYAGTRSLLVSNWAVESVSARLLTTRMFKLQSSNPAITRAEALRQSMQTVMQDKATDYGHPAFWAPFSLVGDGLAQ
jgi:CHAT domain-containing protein